MYQLNGLCDAKFHTPIVPEIARTEFVSALVRLGAPTALHFCQDGGVPQSKWLPFAGVAIFRCVNLMALRFVMLLFYKTLMYFVHSFRRRFNNEQVDLIF